MIVSTPYVECYVKKSFLDGTYDYSNNETIFGVIIAIRFVRGKAPLFFVYLPSIGAVYDKVAQCAIFNKPNPTEAITMLDVGWWDSISNNWQLTTIKFMETLDIMGYMNGAINTMRGNYLFTCEPLPEENVDYGQATAWHEHKTKTFAFDYETGVLFCVPNNRMRLLDQSLSHDPLEDSTWLKVYKPHIDLQTHENKGFFGKTTNFDYSE